VKTCESCVPCINVNCKVVYLPGLGPKGPSLGQVPTQKRRRKKVWIVNYAQQSKIGELASNFARSRTGKLIWIAEGQDR